MHRDIKPSNILISGISDIRICDFGLSRSFEISDAPISKSLTKDKTGLKNASQNIGKIYK
jgi:serine/threonine protein kinase